MTEAGEEGNVVCGEVFKLWGVWSEYEMDTITTSCYNFPLQERLLSSILPQSVDVMDSISNSPHEREFRGRFRRLHISRKDNVR